MGKRDIAIGGFTGARESGAVIIPDQRADEDEENRIMSEDD